MLVIKRYPNRKLYDTARKQYITLAEVASLVRLGQDIQVVDNLTGKDITTLTLSQIILEQEKKHTGCLPRLVLTGLVQSGESTLSSVLNSLPSSPELLHHIDAEIEQRIKALVSRGELAEEAGAQLSDQLVRFGRLLSANDLLADEYLEKISAERDMPTRDDLHLLTQQVEALLTKVEAIIASQYDS